MEAGESVLASVVYDQGNPKDSAAKSDSEWSIKKSALYYIVFAIRHLPVPHSGLLDPYAPVCYYLYGWIRIRPQTGYGSFSCNCKQD
jgi:hypothetical protein